MAEKNDQFNLTKANEKVSSEDLNSQVESASSDVCQKPLLESFDYQRTRTISEESSSSEYFDTDTVLDGYPQLAPPSEDDFKNIMENFQLTETATNGLEEEPKENVESETADFHVEYEEQVEVKCEYHDEIVNLFEDLSLSDNDSDDLEEYEITSIFESLGLNETDSNELHQFFSLFQQVMLSLFSNESLYPTLKNLLEKYPAWLEKNKDTISASDYSRYEKQQQIIANLCNVFEEKSETDSEEVTGNKFEKLMVLLEQMQACGEPPKELMDDMVVFLKGIDFFE